jgi:6-phosphogluconolactonase
MEAPLNRKVQIFPDLEALSHRAAEIFTEETENAIAQRGEFITAISGGSTPLRLYSLLGTEYAGLVDWQNTHIFWADERCVPREDEKSNFRHAHDLWLSKVDLPERNIHRIRGEEDPAQEAVRYEQEMRNILSTEGYPEFDLVLLGMGEEGHTASLFPGAQSLNETKRLSIPVYVEQIKSWRITLTLPVLNNARKVIVLVSGSAKAPVLADILTNTDKRASYPAGLIKPVAGTVTWLADKNAASRL